MDFADLRVKLKKSEKKDKYKNLARELKKTVEHEIVGDTNCNWCTWYNHLRIGTMTGGLGSKRFGETCCHSDSSEKPSVHAGVKNAH